MYIDMAKAKKLDSSPVKRIRDSITPENSKTPNKSLRKWNSNKLVISSTKNYNSARQSANRGSPVNRNTSPLSSKTPNDSLKKYRAFKRKKLVYPSPKNVNVATTLIGRQTKSTNLHVNKSHKRNSLKTLTNKNSKTNEVFTIAVKQKRRHVATIGSSTPRRSARKPKQIKMRSSGGFFAVSSRQLYTYINKSSV